MPYSEHSIDQNREENAKGEQYGQPDCASQVRLLTNIASGEFLDDERALSFQIVAPGELIHPVPYRKDRSVIIKAVR